MDVNRRSGQCLIDALTVPSEIGPILNIRLADDPGIILQAHPCAGLAQGFSIWKTETYERLAAAAAAAFLAALATVEALRRRLVLGGVAGASPINSAVMMLVTKSLAP